MYRSVEAEIIPVLSERLVYFFHPENDSFFGNNIRIKYRKPSIIRHSIIRQLWSSATNLPGHFAITPVSKLP